MSFSGCPGSSVETASCNEGSCPTWSDWSDWSDCSEDCDGGVKSRTRECQNGEEVDCAGSATDEQQCNLRSCSSSNSMVYWDNRMARPANGMLAVKDEFLPSGETMMDRCIAYCLSYNGCIATYVTRHEYRHSSIPVDWRCFIAPEGPFVSSEKWDKSNMYITYDIQFAVFRDYYEANPYYLSWDIDGTIGETYEEVEGLCDQMGTEFGTVGYKGTEGIKYSSPAKNMISETGSADCAVRCFETAGCSAFFVENNSCNYIIGNASGGETNENVSDSGMLNGICPAKAFKNTFTRRSSIYCYIWAPNEGENLIENLIQRNTGGIPLSTWSFKTQKRSPMMTSAQYISLELPDMEGTDSRLRPIKFNIETHVRVAETQSNRKRRSADRESEVIFVGNFTQQEGLKYHKQKAKEAKKAAKQRFIMPRTEDILSEIEAIEQEATSFILDGGLELPDDVEVAATGPVELVEFVQTAADGSVAADCSSGTCECSDGYVDNGNGCEEIAAEQPTTTQAPAPTTQSTTTRAPTTTKPPALNWIPKLNDKMESIFKYSFSRSRPKLLAKWQKLSDKFTSRHNEVASSGCYFADTYEDDSVDFNSVNTCRVSFKDFS